MKLSIFTTGKLPQRRGDLHKESLTCYSELADEVVYLEGNTYLKEDRVRAKQKYETLGIKFANHAWRKEFKWPFIGEQFQRGYEACTGDWVIHMDLDMIFHEKDFGRIRQALRQFNDQPAVSFYKWQFVMPDRYNIKSRIVLAVNKAKFGDRIQFNGGGDLCQPTLDGNLLDVNTVPQAEVPIYNYEKILKTKSQIADDQGRMERAWHRHFGYYQMGSDGTNQDAYQRWVEAQKGKMNKPQKRIGLDEHPKYMQETIKNLVPENWGYDGHGHLERNSYV